MSELDPPTVATVVVNYNGGDLTLACLASLRDQHYPAEQRRVILVDNGSDDGVPERVRGQWTDVTVVETGANLGFAAAVNRGVDAAGTVDHVALLNNDATADPGWLPALVEAIESDAAIGAVNAKVLFDIPFRDVRFDAPVELRGARQTGLDVWDRVQFVDGWQGPAYDKGLAYRWSTGPALLRVPDGAPVELLVDGAWTPAPDPGPAHDVINSVGLLVTDDHFGVDRGYLEVDTGQYDQRAEVPAWTGSAVLLRKAYLDDVGPLDESLFLYYEDLEHAWRGTTKGWRYLIEPAAVVRHVHQASAKRSPRTDVLIERNRLIVLRRHAGRRASARARWRFLLVTASYARRDIVQRLVHGRRPDATIVTRRLRAFGGAVVRRS